MILSTKDKVETKYCKKNNYPDDSVVIYGDTDSVMIFTGETDISKAMSIGKEAADMMTKHFNKYPIKLEFEKVYYPYLLITKKRYAGLKWEKPEKYKELDQKGIETVRRDNCVMCREVMTKVLNSFMFGVIDKDLNKIQIDPPAPDAPKTPTTPSNTSNTSNEKSKNKRLFETWLGKDQFEKAKKVKVVKGVSLIGKKKTKKKVEVVKNEKKNYINENTIYIKNAVNAVKTTISDLISNKIDISKLIITKEISKPDYKGKV